MKENIVRFLFLGLLGGFLPATAQNGQETLALSLEKVVQLAIEQSSAIKYVQNRNVNYFWRWKNFRAGFRPQLTLSGELPNYRNTNTPVTQPDGSIIFRNVAILQNSANLAISQMVPVTGTSIYAASSLYQVRDFNNETTEYSGNPFYLGFVQPIFAYNYMKWAQKTEPLVYDEAQKDFIESVEEVSLNATDRFFRYLRIQTNYNLAESNLRNSEVNLQIAEVKRELGQISENDFSRIKLSVFNAKKALNKANMDLKNADFELKSYIGLEQNRKIMLEIPLNMQLFEIDPEKALDEALENRKETPEFKRRLIQADRDLVQAKRSSSLASTLSGSFGLTNNAPELSGVYQEPEKQQVLRLALSIPILDWGRSQSRVRLAESQRELVLFDVDQEKRVFEREVVVQVEQFNLLRDQLITAEEADKVAENGYLISLKKFQNGEIGITDLNIALSERESAKRDYIASIEDYWESYYFIRILTLYDFELDQKIQYTNPMLAQ
jgi:outer membrane protein